ncbi:MAG: HzsA-related protein [Planctomycetota bacterium]
MRRVLAFLTSLLAMAGGETVDAAVLDMTSFEEIVFVKRKPYSSDHYYTDIDNGTNPDRFLPDNGVYIYNLRTEQERPVVTAANLPGGKGFIGKISLSFDARQILFDFRENAEAGFRIWEVNVDGTGLRQVSFPPADEAEKVARWGRPWHTDDIHPAYLQDGGIIFSSTRCEHTILCGHSAMLSTTILHRMDPDGTNIEQLTQSPVSEFCPVVLEDGRVMYHRWEYVDKGSRVCKTIWSMNPDGSRPQELYGVADDSTTVYMYPQPIPGSAGDRLVSVGTCHYPQGGCLGPIMLLDLRREITRRGPDPDEPGYQKWDPRYVVTNITPHVFMKRRNGEGWFFLGKDGKYVHDKNGTSGHLYTHPYPVTENAFLVSYKVNPADHYQNVPNAYAIYLIDTEANHTPVHKDDALSCWHPTPLVPREVPPEIHNYRLPEYAARNEGLCIVKNVYEGMEGIKPGEVKWLRINEAVSRYWDTARRWPVTADSAGWKAALWPRVQIGVVPVEKDGSAYFKVPADRNIFFQALDKDFRELQRERTYVNYKPGEVRSCVGCHGRNNHTSDAAADSTIMALKRPPSTPQPQPCDLIINGGDGKAGQVLHYPTDIQPIFDAKCISCHGSEKLAGDLNLKGDITAYYSVSYEQLAKKQLAGPIIAEFTTFQRGDRGNYDGETLPPKSLGSYNSTIIAILTDSKHPKNVKEKHSEMLTANELMILSRWVDSNYQFYGGYYGRHHAHWINPDPKNPAYKPEDFRRRPTYKEAVSKFAPDWHR